jgi:hypothetical protein
VVQAILELPSIIHNDGSDSQGVKTQRRNLQHGEDDMRLVFGVMISLCCKKRQELSLKRDRNHRKKSWRDLSRSAYRSLISQYRCPTARDNPDDAGCGAVQCSAILGENLVVEINKS